MVNIRPIAEQDEDLLIPLVAHFRVTLSRFQRRPFPTDFSAAAKEITDYREPDYRIFIAEIEENIPVAYLVCRIGDGMVWVDSLFVLPDYRRQGVGSALYRQAELLAEESESETVYNWVHPNNERMIAFLRRQGYQVLNKIEIRKSKKSDSDLKRIKVGLNTFEYCCG